MHVSKVARHPPDAQHDLCRAVPTQVTGTAPPEDDHHASALHPCSEEGTLSPSTVRSQRSAILTCVSAMSIADASASDGRGSEPRLDCDYGRAADGATVRPAMMQPCGGPLKQAHDHEEVLCTPTLRALLCWPTLTRGPRSLHCQPGLQEACSLASCIQAYSGAPSV